MAVKYGSLPFKEQIAFFLNKTPVPTERWNDLQRDAHDSQFMVAWAMKADLLADLKAAMDKAHTDGTTLREFTKDFERIVAKRGWTGWTGEETKAGRAWRARVIYETNLRTSYQAGRWQQIQAVKKYRPYLLYRHSHAVVTPRAEHLSWDGLVVPVDSDWVKTHYPPNGYGCRCKMFALNDRDLERMGKSGPDTTPDDGMYEWTDPKTGEIHTFPNGVQPFWDYAPGASLTDRARLQIERKIEGLPNEFGDQLAAFIKNGSTSSHEQAAMTLGIKSVDYAHRPDIAITVNAALDKLGGKQLAMPDHVVVNEAQFLKWQQQTGESMDLVVAAFTFNKVTAETYLFIKPSDTYWLDPAKVSEKRFASGFWSSNHPDHAIIHELGHLAHYKHSADLFRRALRDLTAEEQAIASKVSGYAADDAREFVAETFVLLTLGKPVADDVLALYRQLGGFEP